MDINVHQRKKDGRQTKTLIYLSLSKNHVIYCDGNDHYVLLPYQFFVLVGVNIIPVSLKPTYPKLTKYHLHILEKRSIRLKMIDEAVTNVPRALRVSKKNNTNGFIKAHTLSRPRLVLFTFHLWRHQHGRRRLTSRPLARLVIGTLDGTTPRAGIWHRGEGLAPFGTEPLALLAELLLLRTCY